MIKHDEKIIQIIIAPEESDAYALALTDKGNIYELHYDGFGFNAHPLRILNKQEVKNV